MSFKKRINIIPPFFKRGLGGFINSNIVNTPCLSGRQAASLLHRGKFLLIFLILIVSCINPYKNLPRKELTKPEVKNIPYALPYSEKALIYKTNISFYKNDIGGLLIIKKIEESVYRIALTTQFGLKIFDFELKRGKLKVEYCVEYLNKKVILNTFETDFNLLLMQNEFDNAISFKDLDKNQNIWLFKSGKFNYRYFLDLNSNEIVNISYHKRNSKKISVGLYAYRGEIPGEIKLEHHNIKLKMDLKLIQ